MSTSKPGSRLPDSRVPDLPLPDYVAKNRAQWDDQADDWVPGGERSWAAEPGWGIWRIPETDLQLLPADMTGMRTIELGCGTGYVSAWMIRRGASAVGIDISERQLATARRLAEEHGVEFELLHGNAERVPYSDASFDFAISEYGAAIWADPFVWIPEAFRLLAPGGELVFLGNHPLAILTQQLDSDAPVSRTLCNPYFGMHRIDWTEPGGTEGTEFNLPVAEWLRLFRRVGFEVVDYHELRAPSRGPETRFFVTADWAYDYPSEQVWKLRKPTTPGLG
jgi:SAM-dependent methyltransferase